MHHGDAATRSERRAFHMPRLRDDSRQRVIGGLLLDCGVTHGLAADLARSSHIRLHQRRGRGESIGHVVEAMAQIVGGQQLRRIDLQAQQIANRIGVFRAIQTMQRRSARVRVQSRVAVQRILQRGRKGRERGGGRARRARRGHHSRAHLANHFFGDGGGGDGVRGVEPGKAQIARFQAVIVTTHAILLRDGSTGSSRSGGSGEGSRCKKNSRNHQTTYSIWI